MIKYLITHVGDEENTAFITFYLNRSKICDIELLDYIFLNIEFKFSSGGSNVRNN